MPVEVNPKETSRASAIIETEIDGAHAGGIT